MNSQFRLLNKEENAIQEIMMLVKLDQILIKHKIISNGYFKDQKITIREFKNLRKIGQTNNKILIIFRCDGNENYITGLKNNKITLRLVLFLKATV